MPEGSVVRLITITFPPGLTRVGGRERRQRAGLLVERLASINDEKLSWGKCRVLPSGLLSSKDCTDNMHTGGWRCCSGSGSHHAFLCLLTRAADPSSSTCAPPSLLTRHLSPWPVCIGLSRPASSSGSLSSGPALSPSFRNPPLQRSFLATV